tara:strand:- start:789 stop:2930 length:2142 start_codon:yes stop_codon:yes gene_type:complete
MAKITKKDLMIAEAETVLKFENILKSMSPQEVGNEQYKDTPLGQYLRDKVSKRKPNESDEELRRRLYGSLGSVDPLEGTARSLLQGPTFAQGDEIVAAGAGALDAMTGGEYGPTYNRVLASERKKLKQFRETDPVKAYGSEIVGSIPTGMLKVLNVARGGPVLSNLATGSLQGGLYSYGASEGNNLKDQAIDTAIGSAFGGTLGVATVPIKAGIRSLVENLSKSGIAKNIKYKLKGRDEKSLTPAAYQTLATSMRGDDSLTSSGAQRLKEGGTDAMLADSGPAATRVLDTSMQTAGPAAKIGRDAVENRVTRGAEKLNRTLNLTLGKPETALKVTPRSRYGDKAPDLNKKYTEAYATPIDYSSKLGREIENIWPRLPESAIKQANEFMRAEGYASKQIIAKVLKDGTVKLEKMPDVRQIDYITRGLGEVVDQNTNPLGNISQKGRIYAKLKADLRNLVKEAVPSYRIALDSAADAISEINARKFGATILKSNVTRQDALDALDGMGKAEIAQVKKGLRDAIDDSLANVKAVMSDTNLDSREARKALQDFSSRSSRKKMEFLLGKKESNLLFQKIDRINKGFTLKANVNENAKTFARLNTDETIKNLVEGGTINQLRSGNLPGAGREGIAMLGGRSANQKNEIVQDLYSELANVLTGLKGKDAQNMLRQITQKPFDTVEGRGRLANELMRILTAPVAPVGGTELGQSIKRGIQY